MVSLMLALLLSSAVDTPARPGSAPVAAPVAGPVAGPAAAADATQTAEQVQRYYDAAKELHAHFDQTVVTAMGTKKRASGDVWLKKPGRMRWDYAKPEKKLMVADGQTLWVYEPEDEQAFKQDLRGTNLPDSVAFLLGEGRLRDQFEPTIETAPPAGVVQPGEVVLRLAPKHPTSAYKSLLFIVEPRSGAVNGTIVFDQQGGESRIRFSGIETNKPIEDARFKFTPPPGTRVLKP